MFKFRTLLSVTVLTIFFASTSFAAFQDVLSSHESADAIDFVQSEGIVDGYPDGTYKPDQTINRAEFTKIILESVYGSEIDDADQCYKDYEENLKICEGDGECGLPIWEYFAECIIGTEAAEITEDQWDTLIEYDICFPDVQDTDWFRKYVCYAKMEGVIDGYPDGFFRPANSINFVEAAKIIVESFGYNYGSGENWYQPYVGALALQEAIPLSIQSFEHDVTRGEMAEIIYRVKDYTVDKESLTYSDLKELSTGEESQYAAYEDWTIPFEIIPFGIEEQGTDCVGMYNGYTEGGDLLSTLIVDDDARSLMNLDIYTPEHIYDLENRIVDMTHDDYSSDLYAFKACHLGPSLDVVAGGTWPTGKSKIVEEGKFKGDLDSDFPEEALLIIVNGDDMLVYDDIKLVNNTATGAESDTCNAKAEEDSILWSCFMGLHAVDGSVEGSKMKYWRIPLDGSEPEVWEDVVTSGG